MYYLASILQMETIEGPAEVDSLFCELSGKLQDSKNKTKQQNQR